MDHKTLDDDVDDLNSQKNVFFQGETDQELFQGSAVSYIPSSKEDFIKQQQKEDEKFILDALDAERDEILEPIMTELLEEQKMKKQEEQKELQNDNNHLRPEKKVRLSSRSS